MQVEFRSHFWGKKVRLTGREIGYLCYCNLDLFDFAGLAAGSNYLDWQLQFFQSPYNCTVHFTAGWWVLLPQEATEGWVCVRVPCSADTYQIESLCCEWMWILSFKIHCSVWGLYRVIHKSMKHFKILQQIDYVTDHGNSYVDRERNCWSFF